MYSKKESVKVIGSVRRICPICSKLDSVLFFITKENSHFYLCESCFDKRFTKSDEEEKEWSFGNGRPYIRKKVK